MSSIEPGWLWLIGGVLLLIAEVIAPGFFLVFIGAAAIAAGLFTVLFKLGTASQLALFALYAVIAVLVSFLASIYPALKASQVEPVEGLKAE